MEYWTQQQGQQKHKYQGKYIIIIIILFFCQNCKLRL